MISFDSCGFIDNAAAVSAKMEGIIAEVGIKRRAYIKNITSGEPDDTAVNGG